MKPQAPGLYWARLVHDGVPHEEITVVEVDGDGDIWAIGSDEPQDPAAVVLVGIAVPPQVVLE